MTTQSQSTDPILEVSDLGVVFRSRGPDFIALRDVSFRAERRKTLALVGESGSGKSVTSLAAMGLLPSNGMITTGSITYSGRAGRQVITDATQEQMRRIRGAEISMIFQEPMTSLNPLYTIGDQIGEMLYLHSDMNATARRNRVIGMLELVEIPRAKERVNDYPHEFSGGMRQRVMIAMALACNPMLLIADEPTTALDVTIQAQILNLMRKLQADLEMAILFITHDMGVVAEMADDVAVMYRGEIVEKNDVYPLFNAPSHDYTKSLLDSILIPGKSRSTRPDASRSTSSESEAVERVEPLIRVERMSKTFGDIQAVNDVSFEIEQGTIMGLVGESGSGKTTLGRSLLRLTEPSSGQTYFDQRNINELSAREMMEVRKRMQIIFQDPASSLNPRMKVEDVIAEGLVAHRIGNRTERSDRVAALLEEVDLPTDAMRRFPHEFSGGQRQRIGIARALALDPDFIVADESVSALDVTVQNKVLNLLLELRERRNLTMLFITHDLAVVEYLCDEIMVMYNGEIVEKNDAISIYRTPRDEYTKRLFSAIPIPSPKERDHI